MSIYHLDDIPDDLKGYFQPAPQIGLEPTPEAYVARMVEVFREVRRVLRDDGTLWLNIGDGYARQGGGGPGGGNRELLHMEGTQTRCCVPPPGLKHKDLVGIPWLLAFALRADGWYLRSDIIWSKPNPMPESVTDRPTKAHEYIFLLTKSAGYFYDAEAVAEAAVPGEHTTTEKSFGGQAAGARVPPSGNQVPGKTWQWGGTRNRRTVWTIATQPYPEAHFATYPEALVEPCISAGCPPLVCSKCYNAIYEEASKEVRASSQRRQDRQPAREPGTDGGESPSRPHRLSPLRTALRNQVSACCGAAIVPGTVLDPFLGSGTTLAVAAKLGRSGIGIELNPAYIALAEKRIGLAKNPHTWRDSNHSDAASLFHQEPTP